MNKPMYTGAVVRKRLDANRPNVTKVCRCDETYTIHLAYNIIIYYIDKYIASTPDGKSQVVRYCEILV